MDDIPINQDTFPQPDEPIAFIPATAGEVLSIGPMTLRIMEDGSNTSQRLSCCELAIPPHSAGPVPHWHEMHDETFLVTRGTVRFHQHGNSGKEETVDAKSGDYVVVPVRAPHTFSNPFDEEARFFNTFTPSFYINYFKVLAEMVRRNEGRLDRETNAKAQSYFATLTADLGK